MCTWTLRQQAMEFIRYIWVLQSMIITIRKIKEEKIIDLLGQVQKQLAKRRSTFSTVENDVQVMMRLQLALMWSNHFHINSKLIRINEKGLYAGQINTLASLFRIKMRTLYHIYKYMWDLDVNPPIAIAQSINLWHQNNITQKKVFKYFFFRKKQNCG